MEDWYAKAQTLFPELQGFLFENHDRENPMGLWVDLFYMLHSAYEEVPANDDLIGRIYDYAAWSFEQPEREDAEYDLSDATAIGLIESIPLDKKAAQDLYRWMSPKSFDGFENLFRYFLSDEQFHAFREDFMQKSKAYGGPTRL